MATFTVDDFMAAISGQESGGNPTAENRDSGAYGIFQIMPSNWPSWAREAGLGANAPQTEANQRTVARFKMQQYYDQTGDWRDVAAMWYSGQPFDERTADIPQYSNGNRYPTIREYTDQVAAHMGNRPYSSAAVTAREAGADPLNTMGGDLDDMIEAIGRSAPSPDDPRYQETYADGTPKYIWAEDRSRWIDDYRSLIELRENIRLAAMGYVQLPDGTVLPTGDATPEQLAAFDQSNRTSYARWMRELGLDDLSIIDRENATANRDFDNRVTAFNASIASGDLTLRQATADLDRWAKAQAVADSDAERVQHARDQALRYGTSGGKTSFTANELGAAIALGARQAGIDPDVPLLRYPGYQEWDPVGDRRGSLEAMGVSQAPPLIPQVSGGPVPETPMLRIPTDDELAASRGNWLGSGPYTTTIGGQYVQMLRPPDDPMKFGVGPSGLPYQ